MAVLLSNLQLYYFALRGDLFYLSQKHEYLKHILLNIDLIFVSYCNIILALPLKIRSFNLKPSYFNIHLQNLQTL